ncbi:hypothetical protein MGYG_08818 [Nannizzia gypsea CBS 118893]|uniref:Uncharacterized protein n=1 Tax=Arthroderma gypseum (strain ATCC MYA-4604 / CBS 118893) TaxID=535722 RepID=E4V729_ARTGP|nr:hypothetical protein MGYG_08818 [Nannizzia gypsea CBS 118893]EFQ96895.1 hypothetical protein MGYG_08818 [Nannizzia gypsea CBS 118893]
MYLWYNAEDVERRAGATPSSLPAPAAPAGPPSAGTAAPPIPAAAQQPLVDLESALTCFAGAVRLAAPAAQDHPLTMLAGAASALLHRVEALNRALPAPANAPASVSAHPSIHSTASASASTTQAESSSARQEVRRRHRSEH